MKTDKNILIGKFLSGNTSPEEEEEILAWVKENPENEEELNRLKEFWNISINLKSINQPETEKAWQDFKLIAEAEPEAFSNASGFIFLKTAVAIILLAFSFILIKYFMFNSTDTITKQNYFSNNNLTDIAQKAGYITLITKDSAEVFILPDSSRVHLNKNSQFIYPENFSSAERSVSLSGEAFFEIKRSEIPFVILCKQTKTLVLGTSFNIKGYENDNKVTVSVVTGTVQFSNKITKGSETLKANERGVFDNEATSLSKSNYSDKNFVWWKKVSIKTKIKRFIKKITHKNKT